MAYRIGWYIEKQIIFTRLWGVQNQEDGEAVNQELADLLDTDGLTQVYILVDSTKLEKSPPPSMSLHKSTFKAFRNPHISWFIAIGKISTVNNLMGIMLGQIFNMKYRNIPTFEQTLEFIKEQDGTIQWDKASPEILSVPDESIGSQ